MPCRRRSQSFVLALFLSCACASRPDDSCGPESAVVERVIDGDTVELASGERIRYLLVDTPENTNGHVECFGPEAFERNRELVEGRTVQLRYDVECRDRYGRALAYVSVGSREVNSRLISEGFACVLHVPPNGDDRAHEFQSLEAAARQQKLGLWGACSEIPCN
ncbi:MAG TPA: thermonuclease family protein [Polyangiaceae bacterium]|nr:thermonuclease family protein [Polyangiaceae bacterium]